MWSPKGTFIASASSDKTVHVWNGITGKPITEYKGHNGAVTALAWSPDSGQVASGSNDGTVQIWNAFSGKHILTYPINTPSRSIQPITAVAWSSDGTHVASGNINNSLAIWEAATGNVVVSHHTNGPPVLAWSPDGKMLAIGGQHISVSIDNIKGNSLYHYQDTSSVSVLSVAWSREGQHVALGGSDSIVRLWNPLVRLYNSAFIYEYQGHKGPIRGVAFSPDSFYIASCSEDKTVQVWRD